MEAEVDRLQPGAVLAVPQSVLGELDRLTARGTPGAAAARALAGKYRSLPTLGRGDDAVVRMAIRLGAWVVTADRTLRLRLNSHGVPVLSPRDRHRLQAHPARQAPESSGLPRGPNG